MHQEKAGEAKQPSRMDVPPVKVYVTPKERQTIIGNAKSCGLSTSEYARRLTLGYEPMSIVDRVEVRNLLKVNADLGRLGGLLKMWLTDPILFQQEYADSIDNLLDKIYQGQDSLLEVVKRITDGNEKAPASHSFRRTLSKII